MASQEHLQQLNHDDSSTSSSDESSEELVPTAPAPAPTPMSQKSAPPKMRLKLSLRMPAKKEAGKRKEAPKPTATSAKPTKSARSSKSTKSSKSSKSSRSSRENGKEVAKAQEEPVVKATVVGSSDEEDTVPAELVVPKTATPPAPKKRGLGRPIRLPPMSSPGLLVPPYAGMYRGEGDENGFTTPSSVFDHHMQLAGYTVEARKENPHRGSSVQREVGDMFDSDVKLTMNFPPLVPKELTSLKLTTKADGSAALEPGNDTSSSRAPDLFKVLLRGLSKPSENGVELDGQSVSGKKRKRPWQFRDMLPMSLTAPYPESYLDQRVEYVKKVEARERAIVEFQEAEIDADDDKDADASGQRNGKSKKGVMKIPPIPKPPTPPKLSDFTGDHDHDFDDAHHPIYLPKAKEFVEHLDKRCFHITEGRYFGLISNGIADPHFVGPNAPGILGLTVSAGTGLATSHVGNTSAGSASLASTVYGNKDNTANSSSNSGAGNSGGGNKDNSSSGGGKSSKPSTKKASLSPPRKGPAPTSSAQDLKKIMEKGGDAAEEMRMCIMRAAVYASRTGRHGQSFVGPDGETYPDVSKAFAAHAGLRPCMRCKNNKQGAYHCRLRRKHKDPDHDGGDSPAMLQPLFEAPLEDLLTKKAS